MLEIRTIGDIAGGFHVPRYQRGYRWGEAQVERLLDDIHGSRGTYSLQPVVVVAREDGSWELVDGQQRLTTVHLLFTYFRLSGLRPAGPPYTIAYGTRQESAGFLDDPRVPEPKTKTNIDFSHMHRAYGCIERWFERRDDSGRTVAREILAALMERVQVIWYQAPPGVAPTELFTRLNVGRIPLTDAELFKALVLSRAADGRTALSSTEVALQWDAIEHDLRRPEMWAFVSNSKGEDEASRIMLLLEALARRAGYLPPVAGGHVPYRVFEALRGHVEKHGSRSAWNDVLDLHALLNGWFQDRGLYHRIGWLVAVGESFPCLVEMARVRTRSAFAAELERRIRKTLDLSLQDVHKLDYQSAGQRKRAERLLLLANVETVRRQEHSTERYPFHAHKRIRRWSLEHIHAQNAEALDTEAQWSAWLALHGQALRALTGLDEAREAGRLALLGELDGLRGPVERAAFRRLSPRIAAFLSAGDPDGAGAGEGEVGWVDSIGNLVLLSVEDNAALSNAVFEVKRQRVLELDRKGQYIPACTRQVFLKYFTDADAQQVHFWSARDRQGYVDALVGPEGIVRGYLRPQD